MWGQGGQVNGGSATGATGFKQHDLKSFFIEIKKIQCHPSPDVTETFKERLNGTGKEDRLNIHLHVYETTYHAF